MQPVEITFFGQLLCDPEITSYILGRRRVPFAELRIYDPRTDRHYTIAARGEDLVVGGDLPRLRAGDRVQGTAWKIVVPDFLDVDDNVLGGVFYELDTIRAL